MNNTTMNTTNLTQNPYSKFNTYEEYMKQATDPQFIAEQVALHGSYKNYQKALKAKRRKTRKLIRKGNLIYFKRYTLPKLAITAVIITALGYVFFFM